MCGYAFSTSHAIHLHSCHLAHNNRHCLHHHGRNHPSHQEQDYFNKVCLYRFLLSWTPHFLVTRLFIFFLVKGWHLSYGIIICFGEEKGKSEPHSYISCSSSSFAENNFYAIVAYFGVAQSKLQLLLNSFWGAMCLTIFCLFFLVSYHLWHILEEIAQGGFTN